MSRNLVSPQTKTMEAQKKAGEALVYFLSEKLESINPLIQSISFFSWKPLFCSFGGYLIPVAGHVLLNELFVPSKAPPLILPRRCP